MRKCKFVYFLYRKVYFCILINLKSSNRSSSISMFATSWTMIMESSSSWSPMDSNIFVRFYIPNAQASTSICPTISTGSSIWRRSFVNFYATIWPTVRAVHWTAVANCSNDHRRVQSTISWTTRSPISNTKKRKRYTTRRARPNSINWWAIVRLRLTQSFRTCSLQPSFKSSQFIKC